MYNTQKHTIPQKVSLFESLIILVNFEYHVIYTTSTTEVPGQLLAVSWGGSCLDVACPVPLALSSGARSLPLCTALTHASSVRFQNP